MIVNVLSIVLLFVDAVCLALAALVAALAVLQVRAGDPGGADARETFERRAVLGLLAGGTLAGLRILSWPLLYATLASFVPGIDGAMCIYGVARSHPLLSRAVEIAKPLLVLLCGAWLLLEALDRRSRTSPLARPNAFLLLLVAALVLVEAPLEMALVAGTRSTFVVTCCTTVADVAHRPTSLIPEALLGKEYAAALLAAFLGGAGLLALLALAGSSRRALSGGGIGATLATTAAPVLAVAVLPVAWLAAVEVLAPRWMGLPFHHCAYCFLAFRDAPLAIGTYLLGTLGILWAALLHRAGAAHGLGEAATPMARRVLLWSGALLSGSLGMAALHLLLP